MCARFLCAAEVRCNDGAPRVVRAGWLLRAAVEARRVVQTVQCHSEFRAHLVIDELSMLGSVFIRKIFYRASMLFLHLTFHAHGRNLRRCCQFVGILWCKDYTRESDALQCVLYRVRRGWLAPNGLRLVFAFSCWLLMCR